VLYLELLEDVGQYLLDRILAATEVASTPREQVANGFAAYFRFVHDEQSAFSVLFGGGARRDEEFNDTVRKVESAIAEAIAALIETDIDAEHRRLLAQGIVGLAEGTGRYWMANELDLDPDVVAARIADLAWAGLRGVHR
jgi:AcrR family transcriptional regulator